MRVKSHTQGGSLTDIGGHHAVSFPAGSSHHTFPPEVAPASPPADAGPISVDGGHLRVVPPVRVSDSRAGADLPTVVLLHGAGSGMDTPVLTALARRLTAAGVRVARLEMPYRVSGRRAPDRPARLDAVLTRAVEELGRPGLLALAGASMGSRVALRCARSVDARGVLALGFPLQPPGGRPSRAPELQAAGVPVLVVQGARDAFGRPPADPSRHLSVHVVAGADHSFRVRVRDDRRLEEVVDEAAGTGSAWLLARLAGSG